MHEINYYVNKEKGVVVCKITNVRCSVHEEMKKKGIGFPPPMVCELLNIIPDEYVGKAKCSGDDVFDENTGRSIAYKRAVRKMSRAKKKFMDTFIRIYTEDYNETVALMGALSERYAKAEQNAEIGLHDIMSTIDNK